MNGLWMIGLLLLWFVPGMCWLVERGAFEGLCRRTSNRKLLLFAPFFLLLLTYAQKPQNQPQLTLPSRQAVFQQTAESGERMSAELKLAGVVPVSITNTVWSGWTNGTDYAPWVAVPVRKAVAEFELPFAFPVGTNVYAKIYVSASGVIGFDRPRGSVVSEALPCAYGTNGVFLALAWGDNMFKPGRGSRLRYGVESNSFCVLMEDVFSGTNVFSAKAELFENGNIILKYRDLPADHVVGLQNRLGGWQVGTNGTFEIFCRYFGWADPAKIDTDGDSMSDYDEIYVYGTDPNIRNYVWLLGDLAADADADGDGVCNLAELVYGTDPYSAASVPNLEPESGEVQLSITATKPTGSGFDTVLVVGDLQLPVWPGASVTYAVSVGVGETQTLQLAGREGNEQLTIDGSGFALLKDPENLLTVVSAPVGTSGLRAAAAPASRAFPSVTVPQFTVTPNGDLCTHGTEAVTLQSPNEDVVISGVSGSGEQTGLRTAQAVFEPAPEDGEEYFSESSLTVNFGAATGLKAISATNRVFAVHSCYDGPPEFIDGVEQIGRWCPVHHWDCTGSYCEYLDGHLTSSGGGALTGGVSIAADGFEPLVIGGPANLFAVTLVPSDRKLPCPRCGCDRAMAPTASAHAVGGVEASPTVFREDGVTVVRGVAPSDEFWDARVDVQLLPSGNFVQRRYTVTGAEVFPVDPGYALTNAPYWVFNAGTGVMHNVRIRSQVHLPSGTVIASVSGHNARLHAFNRSTQTYDLIATSGSPCMQAVTVWRSAYVQPLTDLVDLQLECPDATEGAVVFAYEGSDVQGLVECSASQRYDARKTGVYFKRKGELGYTDSLVVGKWENVFEQRANGIYFKDTDFINSDAAAFQVFVDDELKANETSVTAQIYTSGDSAYSAGPVTLVLNRVRDGVFASTNLLLVSDTDDAQFNTANFSVANNSNERMFLTKLGGKVNAVYEGVVGQAEVPIQKVVTVHAVIMKINGVPVVSQSRVQNDFKVVNERFAQVGIKVELGGIMEVEEPTGVHLANGLDTLLYDLTTGGGQLLPEAVTLLDAVGTTGNTSDMRFIYVTLMNTPNSSSQLFGLACPPLQEYGCYQNNVLLSSFADGITVAHEFGHLLWYTQIHHADPWNLMSVDSPILFPVMGRKRLNQGQQNEMLR